MGEKGVTRRAFDKDWMLFPEDKEARLPSPVTIYKLSPEELAELDKLPKPTGKAPIKLSSDSAWGRKRKEDETVNDSRENMDTVVHASAESQENKDSRVDEKQGDSDKAVQGQPEFYEGSSSTHRFTAERITQAEELLSREEYIRLKNEGVSDQKIVKDRDKFHYELLTALKKKWGVNIKLVSGPPKPQAKPVPPTVTGQSAQPREILVEPGEIFVEPRAQTASGLTIAQAVELRDELIEDIDDYNHIIHESKEAQLSERVIMAIGLQREIYIQALDRLNEAFERTVVSF
ncbi:MAG: hypothetical protein M1609_07620 [Firmicutes bacterium]|nr:hypothetical protein [Bacillota bacterium]